MSQSMGDFFYPDNPNRRRRFNELLTQMRGYESEFKNLENKKESVFKKARKRLDKKLKKYGYETRDELRQAIRSKISDKEEAKRFDELRNDLTNNGEVGGVILDIICISGETLGVITSIGMMVGAISGPVGWAAIGIVGAVVAGAAAIVAIISFINAMNEKDKLQNGISELWKKRVILKYHLDKLDALVTSVETIVSIIKLGDEKELAKALGDNLGQKAVFGPWNTQEELRHMDYQNGSWTDEDPPLYGNDFAELGPRMEVKLTGYSEYDQPTLESMLPNANKMELLKVNEKQEELEVIWVFRAQWNKIYEFIINPLSAVNPYEPPVPPQLQLASLKPPSKGEAWQHPVPCLFRIWTDRYQGQHVPNHSYNKFQILSC
ncbi:hypothetical protein BDV29DRAFT_161666 [Aspergillus leporis]|uniref:Uncharacterized protein n=1 Tax=Aspergillus leporis TaxID=41062 RepID=A0A5N5WL85_9EURO|nr:hypothetical protein BDV29DRAFT_161666 [Aspergillus leporis]